MNDRDDMQIQVLGPIQVTTDVDVVVTLSPQLKRLLGLLVIADGQPVSTGRLAEYVVDPKSSGSTVRTAVSRLRRIVGDGIEASDGGYRLRTDRHVIDVRRFEALRTSTGPSRIRDLTEALGLFRARPFGDLADEEWATVEAERLDSERAATTEDLAEALVADERPDAAIELLEPHIAEHAYRERPVALMMRALADAGRTTDALRAFQRFRTTLRDDVGLDPSSELRSLDAEILAAADDDTRSTAPSARAPAPSSGLPDGTVTFLFTDIESSTQRWQADESRMSHELERHDTLLARIITDHDGMVFRHTIDGVCAVFSSATAAVDAAVAAQGELELPVRIGLHTGEAELRHDDYSGTTLNRVARLMRAGHGGQILLSESTASLIDHEGNGPTLTDLGRHRLAGLSTPAHVFQVGDATFPPLRGERHQPTNLPIETSSFVGRSADIAEVAEQLAEHHVVTLLGVGGTGKTRLAMELATTLASSFPDGCWMAELAPIDVAEAVPFAIAAGLGLSPPQDGDIVDHVIKRIRHQRLLLIVDNCEHVLSHAADAVERIAAACPTVTLLMTSREPLMVSGERLWPVPSLSEHDAVELFLARAATEAPDLQLDGIQLAPVTDLCDRLDRLPLAIELAASRLRSLTPVELLASIDERFRLLVGGRRSRMERHQTMRGTLDWSYELCTPIEQQVFDRLSVFPSRFSLTSARAIAAGGAIDELDVIDLVPQLVDRSLLQRVTADDGTSRYRMLETVRAYALAHLQDAGTTDETRALHARYVADTLHRLALRAYGPDEHIVRAEMASWLIDAVAAVDTSVEQQRWHDAFLLTRAGHAAGFRQWVDLQGLIIDAARNRQALSELEIALLGFAPMTHFGIDADLTRQVFDAIVDGRWIPRHDSIGAPHESMDGIDLTDTEWNRLMASLDDLAVASTDTRFTALVGLAFCSISADRTEQIIERLEDLADATESATVRATAESFRSAVDAERGEWKHAAEQCDGVLDQLRGISGADIEWLAVSTGFARMRWRASTDLPIRQRDLREPWDQFVAHGVSIHGWSAAISTAVACGRLNDGDLARRFLRWLRSDPTFRFDPLFSETRPQLEAVGLEWERDSDTSSTDTLDELIADVLTLADTLPR
ncbi:MAG: BTAD domain-containing putative transcriptional regulator [Ilumatobacter sp.]|uniref:BTAD domain-containing putative transcriptional regulator n=1 Tax=Ilumatobacter sp. TaxID=1967498 RepID=UPI00391E0527